METWIKAEQLPMITHRGDFPTVKESPVTRTEYPEDEFFAPILDGPLIDVVVTCLSLGGAERVSVNIACGLRQHGFSVRLVNTGPNFVTRPELIDELKIAGCGYTESEKPHLSGIATVWFGTSLADYDYIPGSIWVAHSPGEHVIEQLDKVAPVVDRAISVSEETARAVRERSGLVSTIISNGADPEDYQDCLRSDFGQFTVGCLGRYAPEKRLELAIEAIAHCAHNVRLRLYGSGYVRRKALDLAYELGVADRVDVCGVIDSRVAMTEFNALLLCSEFEGHPMVSVEAMFARVPVIYTRGLGDLDEHLQENIRGFPCEANPFSIAATITRMTEREAEVNQVSLRSQLYAERHFDQQEQVKRYAHEIRIESEGINFANDGRKRVLFAIDRRGWAFDRIAHQVARRLSMFDSQIVPYQEVDVSVDCEAVVCFWWKEAARLKKLCSGKLITCLYDAMSWYDCEDELKRSFDTSDFVGFANRGFMEVFEPWENCGFLIEDGVDCDQFRPLPMPEEFTVGWAGNSETSKQFGIDDLKGVKIIEHACRLAEVRFLTCDAAINPRPHYTMNDYYKTISVYVCASTVEGTPNPSLEALACGRPLITTPVGVLAAERSPALRCVERTAQDIAEAIGYYKECDLGDLSDNARRLAESHSWSRKVESWKRLLTTATA